VVVDWVAELRADVCVVDVSGGGKRNTRRKEVEMRLYRGA